MTTANERTKAVVDTREFLQVLASADEITIRGLVQSVAVCLLRHYPLDVDIEVSAAALPEVWCVPEHGRAVPRAARKCQMRVLGWSDVDDVRSPGDDDDQTGCGP